MTETLTYAEVERRLLDAGIKPTAQRIAICHYIFNSETHPTVEDIKAWADENFPKMSLATVYNTVNSLVEAKLMQALKFSHVDKVLFDNNTDVHYHFLDENTGKVHDVDEEKLELDIKLGPEYQVKGVEVLIRGTIENPGEDK